MKETPEEALSRSTQELKFDEDWELSLASMPLRVILRRTRFYAKPQMETEVRPMVEKYADIVHVSFIERVDLTLFHPVGTLQLLENKEELRELIEDDEGEETSVSLEGGGVDCIYIWIAGLPEGIEDEQVADLFLAVIIKRFTSRDFEFSGLIDVKRREMLITTTLTEDREVFTKPVMINAKVVDKNKKLMENMEPVCHNGRYHFLLVRGATKTFADAWKERRDKTNARLTPLERASIERTEHFLNEKRARFDAPSPEQCAQRDIENGKALKELRQKRAQEREAAERQAAIEREKIRQQAAAVAQAKAERRAQRLARRVAREREEGREEEEAYDEPITREVKQEMIDEAFEVMDEGGYDGAPDEEDRFEDDMGNSASPHDAGVYEGSDEEELAENDEGGMGNPASPGASTGPASPLADYDNDGLMEEEEVQEQRSPVMNDGEDEEAFSADTDDYLEEDAMDDGQLSEEDEVDRATLDGSGDDVEEEPVEDDEVMDEDLEEDKQEAGVIEENDEEERFEDDLSTGLGSPLGASDDEDPFGMDEGAGNELEEVDEDDDAIVDNEIEDREEDQIANDDAIGEGGDDLLEEADPDDERLQREYEEREEDDLEAMHLRYLEDHEDPLSPNDDDLNPPGTPGIVADILGALDNTDDEARADMADGLEPVGVAAEEADAREEQSTSSQPPSEGIAKEDRATKVKSALTENELKLILEISSASLFNGEPDHEIACEWWLSEDGAKCPYEGARSTMAKHLTDVHYPRSGGQLVCRWNNCNTTVTSMKAAHLLQHANGNKRGPELESTNPHSPEGNASDASLRPAAAEEGMLSKDGSDKTTLTRRSNELSVVKRDARDALRTIHPRAKPVCTYVNSDDSPCNKTFNSRAHLADHVRRSHPLNDERYSCGQCGERFRRGEEVKEHQLAVHGMQQQLGISDNVPTAVATSFDAPPSSDACAQLGNEGSTDAAAGDTADPPEMSEADEEETEMACMWRSAGRVSCAWRGSPCSVGAHIAATHNKEDICWTTSAGGGSVLCRWANCNTRFKWSCSVASHIVRQHAHPGPFNCETCLIKLNALASETEKKRETEKKMRQKKPAVSRTFAVDNTSSKEQIQCQWWFDTGLMCTWRGARGMIRDHFCSTHYTGAGSSHICRWCYCNTLFTSWPKLLAHLYDAHAGMSAVAERQRAAAARSAMMPAFGGARDGEERAITCHWLHVSGRTCGWIGILATVQLHVRARHSPFRGQLFCRWSDDGRSICNREVGYANLTAHIRDVHYKQRLGKELSGNAELDKCSPSGVQGVKQAAKKLNTPGLTQIVGAWRENQRNQWTRPNETSNSGESLLAVSPVGGVGNHLPDTDADGTAHWPTRPDQPQQMREKTRSAMNVDGAATARRMNARFGTGIAEQQTVQAAFVPNSIKAAPSVVRPLQLNNEAGQRPGPSGIQPLWRTETDTQRMLRECGGVSIEAQEAKLKLLEALHPQVQAQNARIQARLLIRQQTSKKPPSTSVAPSTSSSPAVAVSHRAAVRFSTTPDAEDENLNRTNERLDGADSASNPSPKRRRLDSPIDAMDTSEMEESSTVDRRADIFDDDDQQRPSTSSSPIDHSSPPGVDEDDDVLYVAKVVKNKMEKKQKGRKRTKPVVKLEPVDEEETEPLIPRIGEKYQLGWKHWHNDERVLEQLRAVYAAREDFTHTEWDMSEFDDEAIEYRLDKLGFIEPTAKNVAIQKEVERKKAAREPILREENRIAQKLTKQETVTTDINHEHAPAGFPFLTPSDRTLRLIGERDETCGPLEFYDFSEEQTAEMPDYEFINVNEDDEGDEHLQERKEQTRMCDYQCDCDPEVGCVYETCSCMQRSAYRNGRVHLTRDGPQIIVECCENCKCERKNCPSVVQLRSDFKFEAVNLGSQMGFGLRVLESIQRGEALMEFTGLVTTRAEGQDENWAYTTIYGDDEAWQKFTGVYDTTRKHLINPLVKGNAARFISHSYDFNVVWMCIYHGGMRTADTRAIVCAAEPLEPGSLAYLNYGKEFGISSCPQAVGRARKRAEETGEPQRIHMCACSQDLCHGPAHYWFMQLTWKQAFEVLKRRELWKRSRMILRESEARGCAADCVGCSAKLRKKQKKALIVLP